MTKRNIIWKKKNYGSNCKDDVSNSLRKHQLQKQRQNVTKI